MSECMEGTDKIMSDRFADLERENLRELAGQIKEHNRKKEAELHYLRWFRQETDFGPAHGDVIDIMHERYEQETDRKVPEEWREDE